MKSSHGHSKKFVLIYPVNVHTKFKVRSFTRHEIIVCTQKNWEVPGYAHAPFLIFCWDGPSECTGQICSL